MMEAGPLTSARSSVSSRRTYRSQGSASAASGRRRRRRKQASKRGGGSGEVYRWDKVVGETEAAVQEVVAAIQAGKPVSRLTWKKFDIIKRRAREPVKHTPGPGAYLSAAQTSAFGTQVRGDRKTKGAVAMGPRNPVKSVFTLPVQDRTARRVKVMPRDVAYGRGRPSSPQAKAMANRARRDAKWAKRREAKLLHEQTKTVTSAKAKATLLAIAKTYEDIPSTIGSNATSKFASAPSFSIAAKLEDLSLAHAGDVPGCSLNPSGIGAQLESKYPSAGTYVFSTAGRYVSRIQEDYLNSLPGPTTYRPKHFAGHATAPAYSLARGNAKEFNPFRAANVGPGSYDPDPSLGKQTNSLLRTAPAHRFGPAGDGIKDVNLIAVKFEQAHERHQPLGVRHVQTRTFSNRYDSKLSGTLKPRRSKSSRSTLRGSRRGALGGAR